MFQLKDDDKLMLLLEINKLIPLCHQLQTTTKTSLQNRVILKVKPRVGHLGKHWRVVHTSLRQVSSSLCAEVHRKSVSCLSESSCSVTDPREQRSSPVRSQAADEFLVTAPSYLHCLHLSVMNALE